ALPRAFRRRGHAARRVAGDRALVHALPPDADAATVSRATMAQAGGRARIVVVAAGRCCRRRLAGADQDAVADTRALFAPSPLMGEGWGGGELDATPRLSPPS